VPSRNFFRDPCLWSGLSRDPDGGPLVVEWPQAPPCLNPPLCLPVAVLVKVVDDFLHFAKNPLGWETIGKLVSLGGIGRSLTAIVGRISFCKSGFPLLFLFPY